MVKNYYSYEINEIATKFDFILNKFHHQWRHKYDGSYEINKLEKTIDLYKGMISLTIVVDFSDGTVHTNIYYSGTNEIYPLFSEYGISDVRNQVFENYLCEMAYLESIGLIRKLN